MTRPGATGERSIALFLLGVLAFNPPILSIFSGDAMIAGIPVLYLYLFLAWSVIILLAALTSERQPDAGAETTAPRDGPERA